MPILSDITSGLVEPNPINLDLGSNLLGTGPGTVSVNNGIYSVVPGSFTGPYQYEVLYPASIGIGYSTSASSSFYINSSVSVFNRSVGFQSSNGSSMQVNNCAAYLNKTAGFNASAGSVIDASLSTSAISFFSFSGTDNSTLTLSRCSSIFPWGFGINLLNSSHAGLTDHETMTYLWALLPSPIPTHFRSAYGSYVNNVTSNLSSSNISGGVPGKNPANIAFIWSLVDPTVLPNSLAITLNNQSFQNVGVPIGNVIPQASYMWTPYSQCLDYANIYNSAGDFTASNLSGTGLLQLMAFGRVNYATVKAPYTMRKAENGSGALFYLGSDGAGARLSELSRLFTVLPNNP